MDYRWSGYAVLMLLSGATCAWSGLYVVRRRGAVGRAGLTAVLVGSALWGLAYGMELAAQIQGWRELWGALKYAGIVVLVPAWLVFAWQYTGRDGWVTRRAVAALSVLPAVVLTVLAIPSTRHLVRSYPSGADSAFVEVVLGPVFYALLVYSALLAAVGTGLLILRMVRTSAAYRRQSVVLLSAIALVWIANVLATVGAGPFRVVDPTPLALAVAGLMLIFGVFRFGLLDLVPIARTTLIQTMPDPVLVLNVDRRVIDHNPAAERVFGMSEPAVLGARLGQMLGDDLPLPGQDGPTQHEVNLVGESGDKQFEVVTSVLGGHARNGAAGYLVVLRDITKRKAAELRLAHLASHDGVTDLPNRALFHDRLEQALAQARRRVGALAVMFLDLDDFKLINDRFGHEVGDEILAAVAHRLRSVLRGEDTVARFGGDEFIVLLPIVDHASGALAVAEKILEVLSEPLPVRDHELTVSASIGIALYPGDGTTEQALLRQSDAAMYRAKATVGSQVRFASSDMGRTTVARLGLERELRTALSHDLYLEFQPVFEIGTGAVWGYEALVRWRHPDRGVIGPDHFVGLAEEIGLGSELDRWVLRAACQEVMDFDRRLPPGCFLSVNLCATPSQRSALVGSIEEAIEVTGFDPSRLVLEISERALTRDAAGMAASLKDLRTLGVLIALDDFGAGATSLGQLGELTLDILKIDKRFVSSLTRSDGPYLAIAQAVTRLGHTLGIQVVAEGIESERERELLIEIGCDLGQGYLLARPTSLPELTVSGAGR